MEPPPAPVAETTPQPKKDAAADEDATAAKAALADTLDPDESPTPSAVTVGGSTAGTEALSQPSGSTTGSSFALTPPERRVVALPAPALGDEFGVTDSDAEEEPHAPAEPMPAPGVTDSDGEDAPHAPAEPVPAAAPAMEDTFGVTDSDEDVEPHAPAEPMPAAMAGDDGGHEEEMEEPHAPAEPMPAVAAMDSDEEPDAPAEPMPASAHPM